MRTRRSDERRIAVVLILITVAIVGYVAGSGRSNAAPAASTREASNAGTTVNYASSVGWRPAPRAPAIPGLAIAQPVVLAPAGDGTRAGLVVGALLGSEYGPIPPQFIARLGRAPSGEVVDLPNTQAYRYSGLSDTGSPLTLTLYTIPTSPTSVTAMVCYAAAGASSYMRTCEQLAATLTIATGSPRAEVRAYDLLTPQAAYGRQIGAAAARVDALLLTLRPELRPGASRRTVSKFAERLADGLASAAKSLSPLRPPPAAAPAHVTLSHALSQTSAAYSALAVAVSAGDASGYASARTQIYSAEAGLGAALQNFTLLGYQ
jgi:hypothetical protein